MYISVGLSRGVIASNPLQDIRDGQLDPGRGAERLGSAWDKELERARKRFFEARSSTDVYYALLSLKNSLHSFDASELRARMEGLSYKPRSLPRDGRYMSTKLEELDTGELEGFLRSAEPRYTRLLIDVRENNGGNVAERLLSLLADKPFRQTTNRWVYTPLMRRDSAFLSSVLRMADDEQAELIRRQIARGDKQSPLFSFTCATALCAAEEAVGKPKPLGRLYQEAVLGESSPARGEHRFKLANGETFGIILSTARTFRADGKALEGNPVRPAKLEYPSPGYVRRICSRF